jgi:ubiquinone/menaquinone biosynthesis C-methylase UbiE
MWHDVECGRYDADLPLWLELAGQAKEGVLDVGAGTGRVALRLAAAGHDVTALDLDPGLLQILTERARTAGVRVATITADAVDFTVPHPVGLVAVPMQTIQLLPERSGFFASARRALAPGGRVAVAIATDLEPYDGTPISAAWTAGPTSPSRSRSGSRTTTCGSSGSARWSAPTASARRSRT